MINENDEASESVSKLSLLLMLLFWAGAAHAASGWAPGGVTADFGTGNETRIARAGLTWDWEKSWFDDGNTHLTGYWDASIAAWEAKFWRGVNGSDLTLADVGVTPVFRYESVDRRGWYLDGGVGPNLLSRHYENHRRNFSTAFQFGDLIGVGYQFERWEVGRSDTTLSPQNEVFSSTK